MVEPAVAELLYLTGSPTEIPLVMPTWARQVPELAEKIDAGYELHRCGHEYAAVHGLAMPCAAWCDAGK